MPDGKNCRLKRQYDKLYHGLHFSVNRSWWRNVRDCVCRSLKVYKIPGCQDEVIYRFGKFAVTSMKRSG